MFSNAMMSYQEIWTSNSKFCSFKHKIILKHISSVLSPTEYFLVYNLLKSLFAKIEIFCQQHQHNSI